MRTTKNTSIALDRLAEVLPGGEVESTGHGSRRLRFERARGPYEVEGSIARCLYVGLTAALTAVELGGLGMDADELRDKIRLRPEGVPSSGVAPHEVHMIRSITLDP